jgi:hypothetical protein
MKIFGVIAIIVGVLLIILTLGGLIGEASFKPGLAVSVILIVAGWLIYRRHLSRP